MARFELLPGGDHSGPGTKKDVANHKPGAKITSEHPLDELFVNRFRRLPDEEEEKPKAKAAVTEPDEEEEEEGEDTTSFNRKTDASLCPRPWPQMMRSTMSR